MISKSLLLPCMPCILIPVMFTKLRGKCSKIKQPSIILVTKQKLCKFLKPKEAPLFFGGGGVRGYKFSVTWIQIPDLANKGKNWLDHYKIISFSSVASNEVSRRSFLNKTNNWRHSRADLVIAVPSALPSIFNFIIADPDLHQIQLLVAAFCPGSSCNSGFINF